MEKGEKGWMSKKGLKKIICDIGIGNNMISSAIWR